MQSLQHKQCTHSYSHLIKKDDEVWRQSVICSRCSGCIVVWLMGKLVCLAPIVLSATTTLVSRFLWEPVHTACCYILCYCKERDYLCWSDAMATVHNPNWKSKELGERLGFPPNPPQANRQAEWSCKRTWEKACTMRGWFLRVGIRKARGSCCSCQACRLSFSFLSSKARMLRP